MCHDLGLSGADLPVERSREAVAGWRPCSLILRANRRNKHCARRRILKLGHSAQMRAAVLKDSKIPRLQPRRLARAAVQGQRVQNTKYQSRFVMNCGHMRWLAQALDARRR